METLYDKASLILNPGIYDTGKVYCTKPLDGSGDLTFTRASNASRVNADGLIEKVRTNLLTYSQDFSTAGWSKDVTMTETFSQTDPNGGSTAVLLTGGTSGNAYYGRAITCVANVPNTFSIYIKGNASGSVSIRIDDSTTGPQYSINYTTSWQRFSVTRTPNQTGCTFVVGGYNTWINGENLSLAFTQLETGDIATDYIPTTTAAVSVGPVSGLPRLDYSGGASCGKLLLEGQRTNLVTYSESLNTGTGGTCPVTANSVVSPDGYTNADTIGAGYLSKSVSATAGTYTMSVFLKYQSSNAVLLYIYDGAYYPGSFNPSTGVATSSTGSATVSMEDYGNGWWRCFVTATTASAISEIGFGSGDVYAYGLSLEAGAYATSYIPTLSTAVTRLADAAYKTGISSLIGQTEGTIFVDINYTNTENTSDATPFRLLGSGSAQMYVEINTNDTFEAVVVNSAGTLVFNFTSAPQSAGRKKIAMAYKGSDFAYYINGVQITVQTSGAFAAASLDTFNLGMYSSTVQQLADSVNQALLFKTRLTDAQCQELTSL